MSHQTRYSSFLSLFSVCPVVCMYAATYTVGKNHGQANTPITNRATRHFLTQEAEEIQKEDS
jgi:hypothetical protein